MAYFAVVDGAFAVRVRRLSETLVAGAPFTVRSGLGGGSSPTADVVVVGFGSGDDNTSVDDVEVAVSCDLPSAALAGCEHTPHRVELCEWQRFASVVRDREDDVVNAVVALAMDWPRFRPRFTMPLEIPPTAFVATMKTALAQPGAPVTGIIVPSQVELRLPEREARLLTPVLHVVCRADDDGGGHTMYARFAPHPHLWMLVVAIYFALGCVGMGGLCWGLAQSILGGTLWPYAIVPAVVALGGFIHGAVLIGQGVEAEHMHVLRSFLERVVDDATAALERDGEGAGPRR